MRNSKFFALAKNSVKSWIDDGATSMAAAIAFYTVFSLTPLLIIVIAIAGFFWGEEAVRGEVVSQLGGLVGENGATTMESIIQSADEPKSGLVATMTSLVVLLVGSTTVFAELQGALDKIWQVPAKEKASGLWNLIRARILSFGLVLALAFLLIVSLVSSTALSLLGTWAGGMMPGWEAVLQVLNTVLSFAVLTLLFALIFKFMPQAKVAWREVWVGALVTAVLFEIGKYLIGLYVGKTAVESSYAAAGSFVVILIWVYYAALVFLLGAEFTWTHANSQRKGNELTTAAT